MLFPIWLYHPEKGSQLFEYAEVFLRAGDGWYESPADFGGPAPVLTVAEPKTGGPDDEDDEDVVLPTAIPSAVDPLFDPALVTPNADDSADAPVVAPTAVPETVTVPDARKPGRPRKNG